MLEVSTAVLALLSHPDAFRWVCIGFISSGYSYWYIFEWDAPW